MPLLAQRLAIISFVVTGLFVTAPAQTAGGPQPLLALESVSGSEPLRDGIQIQAGPAVMRITALRNDIVRVRVSPNSVLPEDASWAVLPEARTKSIDIQTSQDASSVGFRTSALDVRVEREPLRIVIRDLEGNVISADAVGRPTKFQAGGFSVFKQMPGAEHYFGLGDKTGQFDRREQAYTLWNTDIGPQESVDPLYKAIPFFLAINGTRSYGIFLDNTWRTWFDFGKQARDAYAFGAEGGPLDYYFIYGPTPKQVVEAYAYLTGKPPLPPLWALGFQQSRYSYTINPAAGEREIAVLGHGHVAHDAAARRDFPSLKFLGFRIEANHRVRLHARLAIPQDIVHRGDRVRLRLGPAGRRPLAHPAADRIESSQVTPGIIGIPEHAVAGDGNAPRSALRVGQNVFADLHRTRIKARNLVTAEFDKKRNVLGVHDHAVRT